MEPEQVTTVEQAADLEQAPDDDRQAVDADVTGADTQAVDSVGAEAEDVDKVGAQVDGGRQFFNSAETVRYLLTRNEQFYWKTI